ncbi:MAG TPA: HAD family hydrolase [Syntrophomonadaceae bacterium]|nr:HAD family hydrolase [Syntrophomonadaceae bacterium]
MIRLCVFDLDGTLVNSLQDLANSTNYALEKNGFPQRGIDEYLYFLSDGLPMLLQRALGENYTEKAVLLLAADFQDYYSRHYADFTRPYARVPELLNNLQGRGIQLAVLSNKPDNFAKIIVRNLLPETTVAIIQGKTQEFAQKPDPASLLYVLQELRIPANEALYIGDSNVDIFTAHNAGVKAVGVTWGFRKKSELIAAGADYLVDSPLEILQLVLQEK